MKNILTSNLIFLAVAFLILNCYKSKAQQDSSFTFFIEESRVCWTYDSSSTPKFKIENNLTCNVALRFGNTRLDVKNDVAVYEYEWDEKRDSITLRSDNITLKIPSPLKKGPTIELYFISDTETLVDSTKGCVFKASRQLSKCPGMDKDKNDVQPLPSGYLFIPSEEEELKYLKSADRFETTESEQCCPGTKELVFDYAAQCLVPTCDLEDCICNKCKDELSGYNRHKGMIEHVKNCLCKDCKKKPKTVCKTCLNEFRCNHRQNALHRFHPRVGDGMRVRATGTNPYRDNIILHVNFEDRNKEGRASFQAILDRFAKSIDSTQSTSATDSLIPKAQAKTKDKVETVIPKFKDEMFHFFQAKYNADQLSAGFLAQCVTHIQDSIRKHFGILAPTEELMYEKLEEWLKQAPELNKDLYRAMLKEGIIYYNKILNYHTSSAWLFQVKNSDITKLDFVLYSNGQRAPVNSQSFEFFNKGGFTIDYSIGIAINGLVNHAFTSIGFVDTTGGDTITKYRVTRQLGSNVNIGPALLAHAYYRYPIWNRFKLGVTTGFMTNTRDNDFGFNFLFGGSLLFGSEERFNLTSGAVLGKVARLREGLKEGSVLDAPLPNQSTDIPTRDIYRFKWFVGVTYNLGK